MNPISAVPAGARGDTRDTAAVPTDLMGLFAAMFAATTAQPVPVQPTPVAIPVVPEGTLTPEVVTGTEGETPLTAAGGWPAAGTNGTPAFPASMAAGRPRHELPGLKAALVDLPSARHALGPAATPGEGAMPGEPVGEPVLDARGDERALDAAPAAVSPGPSRGRMALPEGMTLVQPVVAQALERALAAAQAANGANAPAAPVVRALEVRAGRIVSDEVAAKLTEAEESIADAMSRDGLRGAAKRTPAQEANAHGAGATGRGKGKSQDATRTEDDSKAAEGEAATAGFTPLPVSEKSAPVAPPHASLAGVTPHPARVEAPAPAVAGVAGPAPLPQEKPLPAVPTTATVSFDNGEGLEGRLRVSLRGDTLRASIQVPDAAAAERIEQDLGGLARALRAHGFEEARLTVDIARSAATDTRQEQPSPREHKPSREQQPHTNERHTRRERGSSREER